MNKVLKFRVWSKKINCWMNHCAVIDCQGQVGSHFWEKKDNGEILEHVPSIMHLDLIIQQFTGLLDKNNKEIFEGDIVKYDGESDITYAKPGIVSIGEFIYDRNNYFYGVRVKRLDMENAYFGIGLKDKDYEIIGNIFENSNLITS